MAQEVAFNGSNYGSQTGINYGSITNEFQLLSDPNDKLPIVHAAMFNSLADQHEQECLPGTRTELLDQIKEWAFSTHGWCIFWLNGMAGTGKSSISRTVAKFCSQNDTLGASFFFKRGENDRGSSAKLFSTIARQLGTNFRWLQPAIQQAVHDDPSIAMKGMGEQFSNLILQPLLNSENPSDSLSEPSVQTVMIVIDALDECDSEKDVRLFLQLLPQLQKLKHIQLRVFLTSRPELPTRLGFEKIASHYYEQFVLHDISDNVIEHDINFYLQHRLSAIRDERKSILPPEWPGLVNLRKLVFLSVPLFIFAATMCRILEDPYWDPLESLAEILAYRNHGSKLDGTYLPVLGRLLHGQDARQKELLVQEFRQIVGAIVTLQSPLSVTSLSRLIGLPERLIQLRLDPLHSVLVIPNDNSAPIRLFHLSFRDYLLHSETRQKSPLWVNETATHHVLTTKCLQACQKLRRNICRLKSDGSSRAELDRQTIQHFLPAELQYACRYWPHHMAQCVDLDHVIEDGLAFLRRSFLQWVEAMSLMGLASELAGLLDHLQVVIPHSDNSGMREFLYDGTRFLLKNCQIFEDAPLQVYSAGLLFAPRASIIRCCFGTEFPDWLYRPPKVKENWSAELQTLEGHTSSINSIAFSSDGLLASASSDHTVRIWDSRTRTAQHTLKAHEGSVNSTAFSPNGQLLASGSGDKTVYLWDTATGDLLHTLKGHTSSVSSVAFSSDGGLLASGSYDETVRVYKAGTGDLLRVIKGHTSLIYSVAFSSKGQMLASGSSDKIIRIWNPVTGVLLQALAGHQSSVYSVMFSPNGRLLASGSADKTVRLWSIMTGVMELCIEDHTTQVNSVAFSSDGRLLASGCSDQIVRHWGNKASNLLQSFEGHTKSVTSVAFSPNNRFLASGSGDHTVKLWDTKVFSVQEGPKQNSCSVEWMAFSPDGRLLVSGSFDGTVRLWDTASEGRLHTIKPSISIEWISFSPDSRFLVCGSGSGNAELRDTTTGSCLRSTDEIDTSFNQIAISHDNRWVACISTRITVQLWDIRMGALHQTLGGHSGRIYSIAFCPDSQVLASGSRGGRIRLWDPATGTLLRTLEGHSDDVFSVTFSPNGRLLASSSRDALVRVWNVSAGTLMHVFDDDLPGFPRPFISFSPDGRCLLSRCDGKVRFLESSTGVLQLILKGIEILGPNSYYPKDDQVLASSSIEDLILWVTAVNTLFASLHVDSEVRLKNVAFSPDGKLVAISSEGRPIQLWNPWTAILCQTLDEYSGWDSPLTFSPNCRLLAYCPDNETVRLWDTSTGALMQTLNTHPSSVDRVFFSQDSRLLVSLSTDNTIRLWHTDTGVLRHIWFITIPLLRPNLTQDSSCLNFNSSSRHQDHTRNPLQLGLIDKGHWVTLKKQKILWLPPESRAASFAIHETLLALGHDSGRISFMDFRV